MTPSPPPVSRLRQRRQLVDESLAEEVGRALGAEAAAQEVDVLLGPGLNIKRNPLAGRATLSTSPRIRFWQALAAGYVRG